MNRAIIKIGVICCILILAVFLFIKIFDGLDLNKKNKNEGNVQQDIEMAIMSEWEEVSNDDSQPAFLTMINGMANYDIKSIEEEMEGVYVVQVTITAPNLGKTLYNMSYLEFPQTKDEKEINKFLCEKVERSEIEETETEIYVYYDEGIYQVSFSDVFVDVMSGSIYRSSQEALVDVLEQEDVVK